MTVQFDPITIKDQRGREVTLRSVQLTDAEAMLRYLRETAAETPYLLREPQEVTMTVLQEQAFLQNRIHAPRELMLVAECEGRLIGSCSLAEAGPFLRCRHRCEVAIALYREYCGAGIGRQMLQTVLQKAKELGYEQAELEVVAENADAIALYESLGFQTYGRLPRNMKYPDGTTADALWMMKEL